MRILKQFPTKMMCPRCKIIQMPDNNMVCPVCYREVGDGTSK